MMRQRAPSPPSARSAASPDNPLVSRPSARLGADFVHDGGTRARAGTQGRHDVLQQADIVLRTFPAGSRVSFRFAPLARDTRAARRRRSMLQDLRQEHLRALAARLAEEVG